MTTKTNSGAIGPTESGSDRSIDSRPALAAIVDVEHQPRRLARCRGDRGEGVISAAIAVLIMAFLGAAMWVGFQQMWKTTEATTNDKITQIGSE